MGARQPEYQIRNNTHKQTVQLLVLQENKHFPICLSDFVSIQFMCV